MLKTLVLSALRRSWRLQRSLTMNVRYEDLTIPVMHGFGLGHVPSSAKVKWFTGILRELVAQRPGAMVDVGANIGAFLLMWVRAVGTDRPYYGFDPHVACVHYLERLINANGLTHHYALPLGLASEPGVLTLAANSDKDVFATVTPAHHAINFTIRKPIRVERGDDVLRALDIGPVAFVKIDVEGGELEVLRGLSETIATHRPVLHLEVAPYQHLLNSDAAARRAAGEFRRSRVQQTEGLLRGFGYEFQRIEYGTGLFPVSHLEPVPGSGDSDYVCVIPR